MRKQFISILLVMFLVSCAVIPKHGSNLTFGMVKKYLVMGVTTQEEILRVFGAPNIITRSASKTETWTYERVSYDSHRYGGSLGLGGGTPLGSGGLGGVGTFGGSKSSSGMKTVTLMVHFDDNEKVADYSVMETHF